MIRMNLFKAKLISSLYTKTHSRFSNLDLETHRQKSDLTQIIVKFLSSKRNLKRIRNNSLVGEIKEQFKYFPEYDQKIRDEMLEIFTKGVEFDSYIFNQNQHKTQIFGSNEQQRSQIQDQECRQPDLFQINKQNSLKPAEPGKNLFRYFPTTLISSQIFRNLVYSSVVYQLLVGHKGISKSISVQLYWYLSNIIVSYQCRKEHSSVPRLNYLKKKSIPKILYWGIEPGQTPEQVRKKILSQCTQMGENLLESKYLTDGGPLLKDYYRSKGIQVILFIDQLSLWTNRQKLMRQSETPKDIKALNKKLEEKQTLTQKETQKLNAYSKKVARYIKEGTTMMKCYYMLYLQFFNRVVCSSSTDIEESILDALDLTRQKSQTKVKTRRLQFEQYLSTQKALRELIDHFMFEVEEKITTPLFKSPMFLDEANKKIIRQNLFERFKDQSKRFYLTPLMISEELEKWQSDHKNQLFDGNFGTEEFIEKVCDDLEKLLKSCLKYSRQKLRERVKRFLNVVDKKQSLMIISQLFIQKSRINEIQGQREDKNTYHDEITEDFQFRVQDLKKKTNFFMETVYNPEKGTDLLTQTNGNIDQYSDKQLFKYKKDGEVQCYFDYEDIEEALGSFHYEVIDFILSFPQDMIRQAYPHFVKGRLFEKLFIETFANGRNSLNFSSEKNSKFDISFRNLHDHMFGFVEIPYPNHQNQNQNNSTTTTKNANVEVQSAIEKYQFLESFKKSFAYMQEKSIKEAVFVPLSKQKYDSIDFLGEKKGIRQNITFNDIAPFNPNIDIAFVNISQTSFTHIFEIYAVDLTLKTDQKSILKKMKSFLRNFKRFRDINKNTIQVNGQNLEVRMLYSVLCPFIQIKGQKGQNQKRILQKQNEKNKENSSEFEKIQLEFDSLINQETILKSFKIFSMDKNSMKIERNFVKEQNLKDLWFYDKLCKIIKKQTERTEKN